MVAVVEVNMSKHVNKQDSQDTVTLGNGKFEIDLVWNIKQSDVRDKRLGSITQNGRNMQKAHEFFEKVDKTEKELEGLKDQLELVKNAKDGLELRLKQEQEKNNMLIMATNSSPEKLRTQIGYLLKLLQHE